MPAIATRADRAKADRFAKRVGEIVRAGDSVAFCQEVLDFDPHDGQRKWFKNAVKPENALVMGNRGGKSQGEAARKVWECASRDGWNAEQIRVRDAANEPYHAINLAMTHDTARLLWLKALALVQKPTSSWLVREVKMTPFPRIIFRNNAILEARSTANRGKNLLGNSYDRASWDEVAFEPHFEYIRDNVLRMRMLDRGGRIDYITTGNGRNDFGRYFLSGLNGKNPDLYCQHGTTYDNPYMPKDAIDKMAKRLPERLRKQNIEGEIIDSSGDYFSGNDIRGCIDDSLDPVVEAWDDEEREAHVIVYVDNRTREWVAKFPTHRYLHSWDLADLSDWTVGMTWDVTTTPHTLVEFERFQKQGWDHVYERIRIRNYKYAYGETWIDSTGVGQAVENELQDIGVHGIVFSDNQFGTGKKSQMLTQLQSMLSLREIRYPAIRVFLEEMQFYKRPDKGLIKDCVMSAAIGADAMRAGGGEAYVGVV